MSRAQDIRNITIIAEKLGFKLEGRTANEHLKWRHPSGALVVTGSNLPTRRHLQNAQAQLRRGLQQAQEQKQGSGARRGYKTS